MNSMTYSASTATRAIAAALLLFTAGAALAQEPPQAPAATAAPEPESGWINTTDKNRYPLLAGGKPAKWFSERATRKLASDLVELDGYRTTIIPGYKAVIQKMQTVGNLVDFAATNFQGSIKDERDAAATARAAYERLAVENEKLRSRSSVWPYVLGVVTGLVAAGLGALAVKAVR